MRFPMFRSNPGVRVAIFALSLLADGCNRETGTFTAPRSDAPMPTARLVELQPGELMRSDFRLAGYNDDAEAIKEGERLYNWFNCGGCHFAGGGGIGPPLMDDKWIYGSEPANIRNAILEGRPNGMPSYGGKVPESELLLLVAYVRSLSGLRGTPETVR